MNWSWRYTRPEGGAPTGEEPSERSADFPSQSDAETWMGQEWRQLLDEGVAAVSLYDDERLVYGPMDLAPPTP